MRQHHSFAHRKGWEGNARRIGSRWRSYVGMLGCAGVAAVAFALAPDLPARWFFVGAIVGGALTLVVIATSGMDDPTRLGDMAEVWTTESFDKQGWPVIRNLAFPDGDLDQLVVAPCGVLAVETKYRFDQSDRARVAQQRRRDLEQAKRSARKARLLLQSKTIGGTAAVSPVLVVWGPGRPDLPDGYRIAEGVHVLDGDQPELWAHLFRAPRLREDERASLAEAFVRYQDRQISRIAETQTALHRICWSEFRIGMRSAKATRSRQREQSRALRARHRRGPIVSDSPNRGSVGGR